MILGVGTDLTTVARFEREIDRSGVGFLDEILSPEEIACARRRRGFASRCAACFAAKEAFFKALGTGRTGPMGWREVEVVEDRGGTPALRLSGSAREAAAARGVRRIRLSLAWTTGHAMATVWLEGHEEE